MIDKVKTSFILLILIVLANNIFFCKSFADDIAEGEPVVYTFAKEAVTDTMPSVSAASAIVMDMQSGRVLCGKNIHVKRSMASTTKIMTAILAIEKGDLDDMVTVSRRAAAIGGSDIGLQQGKEYSLKTLLYGMLLNSGNDAAIAVAEHIGGSLEGFSQMMNKKAEELGAADTSFVNPHGLDSAAHYSTAYDMAIITKYALANKVFSRIVSTRSMYIAGFGLYNTNEMLSMYMGADGVKTGYTGKAGRCLITSATRDGMRLISVVMGCPTRFIRAESTKKLLDFGFKNYKMYTLMEPGTIMGNPPVSKGKRKSVTVRTVDSVKLPLTVEEYENMEIRKWLPVKVYAPIYAASDCGYIQYVIGGDVIAQLSLKVWEDAPKKDMTDYLLEIIKSWGMLLRGSVLD